MPTKLIKNRFRKVFVGKKQNFSFNKVDIKKFKIPSIQKTNIYIHIPFCKSMCPYCPYNRVLYEEELVDDYLKAILTEIDLYSQKLGKIEISSVYIGGGTPTNLIDELKAIIDKIKEKFIIKGDIAIETTIADINEENVEKLKSYGINMISIGVQSFDDKYLKLLGRNYSAADIEMAVKKLKAANFDTINIDLIFAFPQQTSNELLHDLKKVKKLEVDQITTYPLFSFPYSTVGQYLKSKKVKMPNFFVRKKFYNLIHDFFKKNKYHMASVWSFKKDVSDQKYSSVTRDNYIGFGAGAASRFDNLFYFNTFSIPEYQKRLFAKKLPIAIDMPIGKKLSNYYWFYWRLYETKFSLKEFDKYKDQKMELLLKAFVFFGFCKINKGYVYLNKKGSFWIHLAQNHIMLDYINTVWSVMKKEPFPKKIKI